LPQARFNPQRHVSELPGVGFQRSEQLSSDSPPPPRRLHEHALDFADARFQFTNGSAGNGFAIGARDKKSEPTICDVFWTKAVKRDAGISATQIIIECPNEPSGISGIRRSRHDLDS
jgi:hypothetical protein